MGLFDQFQTDAAKENDGVSVNYGVNADGSEIEFTLARAGKTNKGYVKLLAATLKPYARAIEMKTADEKMLEAKLREVFVGSVLKGWKNVQDKSGAEIAFTKENAIALLTALPDLYDDLDAKARDLSLFRVTALENEAGN